MSFASKTTAPHDTLFTTYFRLLNFVANLIIKLCVTASNHVINACKPLNMTFLI